nr:hypothetical protein B0A51_12459 [Rachicladosporium sp. CCFEE 5018]
MSSSDLSAGLPGPKTNAFKNGQPFSDNYWIQLRKAQDLPVTKSLQHLREVLLKKQIMILVSETGSGKTTQVPKAFLNDLPPGQKIALTQNRRITADSIAYRLAELLDVSLPGVIGLCRRGLYLSDGTTLLQVVTDGALFVQAKTDPLLSAYHIVVIDEAHQHTISTDLLLGHLRWVVKQRGSLKIIIMSATIDSARFQSFFSGSVVEKVQGRQFDVAIKYLKKRPEGDKAVQEVIIKTILQAHRTERPGNILVFVPGIGMINGIIYNIRKMLKGHAHQRPIFQPHEAGELELWPLYGSLPSEDQDRAIMSQAPPPRYGKPGRKVIIATNIAETSITFSRVSIVIDSGLVNTKIWNPETESWILQPQLASEAVASQRAGRAGRTRNGVCYRMSTQKDFVERTSLHSVPAIQNGDMVTECLDLLVLRHNPIDFEYMDPPAPETVGKALEILKAFGAIKTGRVTGLQVEPNGFKLSHLPCNVYNVTLLLEGQHTGCQDEALSLVAMLESIDGDDVFLPTNNEEQGRKQREGKIFFRQDRGDHIMYLNMYLAWRNESRLGTADAFLRQHVLKGSVLRAADALRKQLLKVLMDKCGWQDTAIGLKDSKLYIRILCALANANRLRIAMRDPSDERGQTWRTMRTDLPCSLYQGSCQPDLKEQWIVYNENYAGGQLRLVTPIPLDIILWASPRGPGERNLADTDFVTNALVERMMVMTKLPESLLRTSMPSLTTPSAPSE